MRNPISELIPAAKMAKAMQARINAAASVIPGLEGTNAANCIGEKGVTSSFFYAQTFASASIGLNINQSQLNEVASSIIIIDEIIEQGTAIEDHECISASLKVMGHAELEHTNPLAFAELVKMQQSMKAEYRLSNRQRLKMGDAGFYDMYYQVVGRSFGMMPLFALAAEENGEQEAFNDATNYALLENVEAAARIMADIITVGKDINTGANNLLLAMKEELTDKSIISAKAHLISEVLYLIDPLRKYVATLEASKLQVPQHLRFALNFAEVLENTAGIEDGQLAMKSPALKLMGSIIQHMIFPVNQPCK